MPFFVIQGQYEPEVGIPDGDSARFRANNNARWKKLDGRPIKMGEGAKTKGTVQLRFEGIDAIEKAAQKPLSVNATDNMKKLIGYKKGSVPTPSGYVLARMTDDRSGRPIAFAFSGACPWSDGQEVVLTPSHLKKSVNYKQMSDGFAYPLYYNTLYAELREEFNRALKKAKSGAGRGYWPKDKTQTGVVINGKASLETINPIWPKLWRRLQEFLRKSEPMSKFVSFLDKKNERLDVLDEMAERGLQDLVGVQGKRVWLKEPPENLRVRGKAGKRK